jgi:Glycosyl transferase family 2
MGQLAEVLAVTVEDVPADGPLLGASIDAPMVGRKVAAQAVEIGGWALGGETVPEQVEVVLGGHVIARAPVRQPRPDIAKAYPEVAGAASAGFEVVLDASRTPAEVEVEVRARFPAAAISIGTLRLRRCWREESGAGTLPPVSAIVVCDVGDEELEQTMRSIADQRCGVIELLIVHPSQLSDSTVEAWQELGVRSVAVAPDGAAALRNEGIRGSNGQLVAFLEAGSTFAPGALRGGVEALERHPEAAGLVDGVAGGDVAGAIYRRSAFEELGGFDDRGERSCDSELARRAAIYDALFEPGVLIAGPEG